MNMKKKTKPLTRRDFLRGAAGAAMMGAGSFAACRKETPAVKEKPAAAAAGGRCVDGGGAASKCNTGSGV